MTLEIYTTEALAKLLGCSITTIEEKARAGTLPGLKYGDGGWIFPQAALEQRLNEMALEEALARRKPNTRPSGVMQMIPPDKPRRKLPKLPSLSIELR